MKKIMFGIIGLLALVLLLLVFRPESSTVKYREKESQPVVMPVVTEQPKLEVELEQVVEPVFELVTEPEVIEYVSAPETETEPIVVEIIEEPVEEPVVEIIEQPAEEPVEQPVAEAIDLTMEPIDIDIEEKVVEPEEEYEERVAELPEYELELEAESGELFFEEFVKTEKVTSVPVETQIVYAEPEYSNKGFFIQSGMNLGGGLHDYHGDRSLMYTSGIELKTGAFFTEHLGVYAFAKPDFFAEIKNITTFIALPNSVHVTAGAGVAFDFGKLGVQAQAGYSILNVGFNDITPYAFGSFSVIPEFNFVKSGKTTVKLTMPLTLDLAEKGYDVFGGLGLSVKFGGKAK